MIKGRNIICVSSTEWGGDYIKASVELMKILAQSNTLLFVNSPVTISEVIAHLRGRKKIDLKRALGFKNRLETITLPEGGGAHILTPPVGLTINFLSPGPLYRFFLNFNAWQVRRSTKKALRKLNMQKDLIHFVAFNPGMGLINGRRYGERSLIYHCYDEMNGVSPWLRKHGVGLEKEFLKQADGVIVTSQNLYNNKSTMNKRCFIVKNAVNFNLFSQGFRQQPLSQPVICYVGSIDDRIDYNVMEHLMAGMPNARFVFVGRIVSQRGAAILKKYPHAQLVGAKRPEELPAYLQTFSVGIIPFVDDMLTRGIYPLKVNEYLAAGLPVISTDFGDMCDFEQVACVVRSGDKKAFLECTLQEISNDNMEERLARQQIAKNNTWTFRAEQLSDAILNIEAQTQRD